MQNPSRERCIDVAMELVRVICDGDEEAARWGAEPRLSCVLFHYPYFAFDGTVALAGALSQDPPHPKAGECLDLIYRAMGMLEGIKRVHDADSAREDETDAASRALTILAALRKAGRWDERFGRKGRAPPACDLAADIAPSTFPAESPVDLYGLAAGGFPLAGTRPFDPTQLSSAEFEVRPQPSASAAIPFLNADRHTSSMFPCAGPTNTLSVGMETGQGEVMRDLGVYMSLMAAAPSIDLGEPRGIAQSMVMPFDMLQNSENDIDWGAVMNSASDTGNWFIG